jgi:predicted transcriptional regulator
MIKQILQLISQSGVVNESELAQAANTSSPLVQQAIAVLLSKGYLAAQTCSDQTSGGHCCVGCHGHCTSGQMTPKSYVVTEKGKKYLQSA